MGTLNSQVFRNFKSQAPKR